MTQTVDPKQVMNFFSEIEKIPRGSGNEKGISDYLVAFAKDRGLEVWQDNFLNVIIKKPASSGYENRPAVILQGHIDMVCEKTPDSTHDFEKDPLELVIDGEWLHAKDTTLGADNGIAVAMALAILDDDTILHGPLEVLLTTSEETGMDGALNVDGSLLEGKYLLNIDTEEEGEFIVSCAGGCRVEVEVPLLRERHDPVYTAGLRIAVDGLHGGHSGMEIYKQRANANQLLARILYELARQYKYEMSSFSGGTKHNAIPRHAEALLTVREDEVDAIRALLKEKEQVYRTEFTPQDEGITIIAEPADTPAIVYAQATTEALLSFLYLAPHGVIGMSQSLPNLVETSINLAIVQEEEHAVKLLISLRSSSVNPMHYLSQRLLLLATVLGVKANILGRYPAWEYEPGSDLEKQTTAIYEAFAGKKPVVTAIHAGLECGLLKGKLPHTQMISFGPTIEHAHTPRERLNLPSAGRIYEYLKLLLKELK